MTYRDLMYKATRMINNNEITLGEYENLTRPLDREIDEENKEVIAILEDIEKTMKNKRDTFFTSHKLIERGYEFAVSDLGYVIRDKINALGKEHNDKS